MTRLGIALLLLAASPAYAQPMALVPPPQTGYHQVIGARLPLTVALRDEADRSVTLSGYFGRTPVVLVFGYLHCPNLCETVMEGVMQALAAVALPKEDYQVIMISVDPRETAALARRKKSRYAAGDGAWTTRLHLLRGESPAVSTLARAAGFRYSYDRSRDEYTHPAGFLIANPDGRISRYFPGVRHEPRDVRLALVEAADGRLGTPADRLLLLCSHYDPAAGRYSVQVMAVVRAVSLALVVIGAAALWRLRRRKAPS